MSTSNALRDIFETGRPLIEQSLDIAEQIAALRDVATNRGLDWSQVKALLKAQIQDERDESGDGKRVRRIVEKAEFASAYADMLGLAKMNEEKCSEEQDHADGLPGPEESREDDAPATELASSVATEDPRKDAPETAAPIQESEGGGSPGTRVAEAAPDEASAPITEPAAPPPPWAHGGTGEAGDTRSPASPTITEDVDLPPVLDRRSKAA